MSDGAAQTTNMGQRLETQAKEKARWQASLNDCAEKREQPLRAVTFRRAWRSKAQPILVTCSAGGVFDATETRVADGKSFNREPIRGG